MKILIHRIISKLLLIAFLFTGITINAQITDLPNRDISVKILNKRGRPISKVVVHSLRTTHAGITDRTGLFVFRDMSDKDTISVILPKYGKTLIPVAGMDSIVISLRSSVRYSYEDNSGQNFVINKDKTNNNVIDVQEILKRRQYEFVSDLINSEFRIGSRGVLTFNGDSEPLVVLNGVPVGTITDANGAIDVRDIKTMEIKKNGNEWGSRGANGVILIKSR